MICNCCMGDPELVCDSCGSHDCWAGNLMCDESRSAGITKKEKERTWTKLYPQ